MESQGSSDKKPAGPDPNAALLCFFLTTSPGNVSEIKISTSYRNRNRTKTSLPKFLFSKVVWFSSGAEVGQRGCTLKKHL